MGGLMGLSLAVIAMALWQMRRRLRRDVDAALLDIAADDLAEPDAAGHMTRLANRFYLVLADIGVGLGVLRTAGRGNASALGMRPLERTRLTGCCSRRCPYQE